MYLTKRNGVWHAKGEINGRLYRESTGFRVDSGKTGRTAALAALNLIENRIRSRLAGLTPPAAAPTFREYWEQTYRPTYTTRKRAPERDDQVMAHALPTFGAFTLDAIRKSDCEAYLNARRKAPQANPRRKSYGKLSEGTVQREASFLRAVCQQAVEDGLIAKNPWRGIKRVAYAVRERLVTPAQQDALLERLSPRFQRFVWFLLGTGIRLEECRGINAATDLDLERRLLRVTGKFGKTRTVPVPAELVPVLQQQLLEDKGALWPQNPQRLREVLANACRAVEPSPDGTRAQWQRKAQTALPHISPHDLRHTFGHRWLNGGGDIYALSKILGHASIAVTQKHYAHLLKEDLRAKSDAVDLELGIPESDGKVLTWRPGMVGAQSAKRCRNR